LTATALIATWAASGLAAGAALSIWTRHLLKAPPRRLSVTDWVSPLFTVIIFGILAWRFGPHFDLLQYSALAAVGIQLAVIDVIEQRLPGPLVYVGLALVGSLLATSTALSSALPALLRAVAGMAALAIFYLALALVSRGGLGAGDVKLGALMGMTLGWAGWSALITATFLGWFVATLVWLIIRVSRRKPRGWLMPMGPFMVLGALLTICVLPR
jgi:leader peptidase (prepilin peptidase)/N-methyltransferase